jgi:hypothetical protein
VRGIDPNGMPHAGWYERYEGIIRTVPPSVCWMCGSTMTFINRGYNTLCPHCDLPKEKE